MPSGETLPLPKDWQRRVKSAVVQVVGMAHLVLTHVRGRAADDYLARTQLVAENERLATEVALLLREMELLRSRLDRVPAKNRPHYSPSERLAILELKAEVCAGPRSGVPGRGDGGVVDGLRTRVLSGEP
jgi:hypothetical protein